MNEQTSEQVDEIQVMRRIIKQLEKVPAESRGRVMRFVFDKIDQDDRERRMKQAQGLSLLGGAPASEAVMPAGY